ncbi:arginase [Rhizobium sp. RAF56]|uniref:arginase n=1 Tax=Rhizobium sp. RAF56 TaxID=3233062 RepID=UPI003F9BAE0B
MQILLLHLDDALERQGDFVRSCLAAGARELDCKEAGRAVRLWAEHSLLEALDGEIAGHFAVVGDEPQICFMGSGDFHHVTALLLRDVLERHHVPTTLVHIDNHPDWVEFRNGLHCGSWVNSAHAHHNIAKVITIGVCSRDLRNPEYKGANLSWLRGGKLELYPYHHEPSYVCADYGKGASFQQIGGALHWSCISAIGEQTFLGRVLGRIETSAVYLTIDKDVLADGDAMTNWDQGRMRIPYLLSIIEEIGRRHRIIGADVIGDYSVPSYGGNRMTRFIKRVEITVDQPRGRRSTSVTENINSAANHALLAALSEVME